MVTGHKEDGVFHPHDSKKGIHSGSINQSTEIHYGFLQRGNKKPEITQTRSADVVNLQNRANIGIRAYTGKIKLDDDEVVIEIQTNVVKGKYMLEPYWDNQEKRHKSDKLIRDLEFNTFEEAKKAVEDITNTKIVLDRKTSNDYQTWEENIKHSDEELPFSKVYWSLPERTREQIQSGESVENFVKRVMTKKGLSSDVFFIDEFGNLRHEDGGYATREHYDKFAEEVKKRQFG